MNTESNHQHIEEIIEAQARGENTQGVPMEDESHDPAQSATERELDPRVTKGIVWGGRADAAGNGIVWGD